MISEASDDLDMNQRLKLEGLMCSYANVFAVPDGQLVCTDRIRHTIDTGDARPIRQVPRRLAPSQHEIAEKEINKMFDQGTMEPSDSPWAAPIILVAKKDGTTRFCLDYRKLNNVTRKDAYPLPRIDEILDTLSRAQWISTLDMASGYYQILSEWMIEISVNWHSLHTCTSSGSCHLGYVAHLRPLSVSWN